MPTGSCACGEYKYEVPEDPKFVVICHCRPCRKFAGSNGSVNAVCPPDQYKRLSGEIRSWTRKGDSGKDVTNSYCANCNNLMFVDIEAMPSIKVYKAGTLDDKSVIDKAPPVQEVYTEDRPDCFAALAGCEQKLGQT